MIQLVFDALTCMITALIYKQFFVRSSAMRPSNGAEFEHDHSHGPNFT